MNDPKRLLEEGSALETSLLGAALDDAPRKGLDRRIQAALGIGGIAISASTASTTAAAASKAAPWIVSFTVAKWAGVVAIGAGAVVGAAAVAHHESARHPSTGATNLGTSGARGVTVPRPVVAAPPVAPELPAAPARVDSVEPPAAAPLPTPADPVRGSSAGLVHEPMAPLPPVRPQVMQAPAGDPAAPPSGPALSAELKLMDGANAALESGDSQLALTLLDRHDLEFSQPRLAPEALELRMRAYALRHDDVKVRELGRAFVARYPDNPLVPRVRSLMSDGEQH